MLSDIGHTASRRSYPPHKCFGAARPCEISVSEKSITITMNLLSNASQLADVALDRTLLKVVGGKGRRDARANISFSFAVVRPSDLTE